MYKLKIGVIMFLLFSFKLYSAEREKASDKKHFNYGARLFLVSERVMHDSGVISSYIYCPGIMLGVALNDSFGFQVHAAQSFYDEKRTVEGIQSYYSVFWTGIEGYYTNNLVFRKLFYSINAGPAYLKVTTRQISDDKKEEAQKLTLTFGISLKYFLSKTIYFYATNKNFIIPKEKKALIFLGKQYLSDPKIVETLGFGFAIVF